jgi:hypothetical protein
MHFDENRARPVAAHPEEQRRMLRVGRCRDDASEDDGNQRFGGSAASGSEKSHA